MTFNCCGLKFQPKIPEGKFQLPRAGQIQAGFTPSAAARAIMVELLLQTTGRTLARLPEPAIAALAWLISRLVYFGFPGRRRLILSNLHHAFPEKPAPWRRGIARECIRRFSETGLLSLATPFLSPGRLRAIIRPGDSMRAAYAAHRSQPHPILMCAPHMAHWETQTVQPMLLDGPFPESAAIFRPLDHPAADAWIKRTRERFGMKLLSRREGFQEAMNILRRNGSVGILYDQNAGDQGALTLLFDRVCSTTDLPGLLAARYRAAVYGIYPRDLGFWRVELNYDRIEHDGASEGVTAALNVWLEKLLRADDNLCASWLWGHQRWKSQDVPARRLRLAMKRNNLATDLRVRGLAQMPRRTRLWIRLPNWLGDVVMALPLLRALRASRPDAEITLLAKARFLPLLEDFGVADRLRPLPPRAFGCFRRFHSLRSEYPDCWLLFTNSLRGDLEAWSARCRQRFGIELTGRWRPLLSHTYVPPAGFDGTRNHQFKLWTAFLNHFGLDAAPDLTPFPGPKPRTPGPDQPIGLICGSENNPEKRWPVGHWRALIESLPRQEFLLLGTANDRPITGAVAAGFGGRVQDLAGQTDLRGFAAKLRECRLLVANDTGGMHLANALGVPLIALFGPTNPLRTGPVFSAPGSGEMGRTAVILQPPGCPPTGGGSLADLTPDTAISAVRKQFSNLEIRNS